MKLFNTDPVFMEILKMNLLYVTPFKSENSRKNKKHKSIDNLGDVLNKRIIMTNIFLFIVYIFLFIKLNFRNFPFLFDIFLGLFIVLSLLQNFTYFYNVFYESKDVYAYMSLPIKEKTVFNAKIATVVIGTFQVLMPVLALNVIFQCKINANILQGVVLGIIDYIYVFVLVILLNAVIMKFFEKMSILSKMRKKIINFISIISMIVGVGLILVINGMSGKYTILSQIDGSAQFGPLSRLLSSGKTYIITIVIMSVILWILYNLTLKKSSENFYEYINSMDENINSEYKDTSKNSQKPYKKQTIAKTLFKYNKSLMSDTTVVTQTFYGLLMPLIFIIPQIMAKNSFIIFDSKDSIYIMAICIGASVGLLSTFSNSNIASIIISLDRENYDYIKSLPISEKKYILNKYLFVEFVNLTFTLLVLFIIEIFFMKYNIIAFIISALYLIIASSILSFLWILFDYKHLNKSWQNVTELYNRMNKAIMIFYYFLGFALIIIASVISIMAISSGYYLAVFLAVNIILIIFIILTIYKAKGFFNSIK